MQHLVVSHVAESVPTASTRWKHTTARSWMRPSSRWISTCLTMVSWWWRRASSGSWSTCCRLIPSSRDVNWSSPTQHSWRMNNANLSSRMTRTTVSCKSRTLARSVSMHCSRTSQGLSKIEEMTKMVSLVWSITRTFCLVKATVTWTRWQPLPGVKPLAQGALASIKVLPVAVVQPINKVALLTLPWKSETWVDKEVQIRE